MIILSSFTFLLSFLHTSPVHLALDWISYGQSHCFLFQSENAIDFNIDGGGIEVNGDLDASVATEITPISITGK